MPSFPCSTRQTALIKFDEEVTVVMNKEDLVEDDDKKQRKRWNVERFRCCSITGKVIAGGGCIDNSQMILLIFFDNEAKSIASTKMNIPGKWTLKAFMVLLAESAHQKEVISFIASSTNIDVNNILVSANDVVDTYRVLRKASKLDFEYKVYGGSRRLG